MAFLHQVVRRDHNPGRCFRFQTFPVASKMYGFLIGAHHDHVNFFPTYDIQQNIDTFGFMGRGNGITPVNQMQSYRQGVGIGPHHPFGQTRGLKGFQNPLGGIAAHAGHQNSSTALQACLSRAGPTFLLVYTSRSNNHPNRMPPA